MRRTRTIRIRVDTSIAVHTNFRWGENGEECASRVGAREEQKSVFAFIYTR